MSTVVRPCLKYGTKPDIKLLKHSLPQTVDDKERDLCGVLKKRRWPGATYALPARGINCVRKSVIGSRGRSLQEYNGRSWHQSPERSRPFDLE